MKKSVFYPSDTSLTPIRRNLIYERFGWPEFALLDTESNQGARDNRRLRKLRYTRPNDNDCCEKSV